MGADDSIESKHVAHVSIVVDIRINCCVRLLHLVPIFDNNDGTMQLTYSISQVRIKKGLQTYMAADIFKIGEL